MNSTNAIVKVSLAEYPTGSKGLVSKPGIASLEAASDMVKLRGNSRRLRYSRRQETLMFYISDRGKTLPSPVSALRRPIRPPQNRSFTTVMLDLPFTIIERCCTDTQTGIHGHSPAARAQSYSSYFPGPPAAPYDYAWAIPAD